MMDGMVIVLIVAGLVVLTLGGELLVRGAAALAGIARISPLVIGLTVVAFGTSAPELAVSVQAGLNGQSDIAVGNVVGSNIFNILVILGICALLSPLMVHVAIVRREVPIMLAASLLFTGFALDGRIGALDGAVLVSGIIVYVAWSIRASRRETAAAQAEYAQEYGQVPAGGQPLARVVGTNLVLLAAGLAALVIGARWLVDGAVQLARGLGVDDVIIGLTIIAAGTSLPEVATSVIATLRRERDIAIGNAVGSNIFNLLAIIGISSLVTPGGLTVAPNILAFDLPFMIAVAVACLPVFFNGYSLVRWEGGLFFASYVAYVTLLVLAATGNPALESVRNALLLAMPLVLLTLGWATVQAWRRRHPAAT